MTKYSKECKEFKWWAKEISSEIKKINPQGNYIVQARPMFYSMNLLFLLTSRWIIISNTWVLLKTINQKMYWDKYCLVLTTFSPTSSTTHLTLCKI